MQMVLFHIHCSVTKMSYYFHFSVGSQRGNATWTESCRIKKKTQMLDPWKHINFNTKSPGLLDLSAWRISIFLELVSFFLNQPEFRKGRGTNIHWIIKKAREFQKNIYFCFIDCAKAFDCVDHNKLWKILKEMGIPDHLTCLWETCMQVRKQQLELDTEQQTGSK